MGVGRSRGERKSDYAKHVQFIQGMYEVPGDPQGATRHNTGTRTTDQMHMVPERPGLPVYAEIITWPFYNDYHVNSSSVWNEANTGSGTVLTPQDDHGGVARFTNAAADDDFYSYISKYEPVRLQNGRRIAFRGRFKVGDADQADLFFGLCANLGAGNLFDTRVDAIGVYLNDGSAALGATITKDSNAVNSPSLLTVVDDTWVRVGFNIDGVNRVTFFLNDAQVETLSTVASIPDDEELGFAFGCRNGQAVANVMNVGLARVIIDE